MMDALTMILMDLLHLAETLALFLIVACLAAPVAFGWYHVDKCKEERNQ